jgi:hypothetical protein
MDARQVAGVVADLTSGWSVHASGKAADLQTARLALAAAVGIGKAAEELDRARKLMLDNPIRTRLFSVPARPRNGTARP